MSETAAPRQGLWFTALVKVMARADKLDRRSIRWALFAKAFRAGVCVQAETDLARSYARWVWGTAIGRRRARRRGLPAPALQRVGYVKYRQIAADARKARGN